MKIGTLTIDSWRDQFKTEVPGEVMLAAYAPEEATKALIERPKNEYFVTAEAAEADYRKRYRVSHNKQESPSIDACVQLCAHS